MLCIYGTAALPALADSETVYLGLPVTAAPAPAGNPPENSSALVEGSGDFDGDGRFGADEDSDGDDVFHTIAAIPGFKVDEGTGGSIAPALRYNAITIVSSGVFREFLRPARFGSTTIEAAPGVRAIFDAQGTDADASIRRLNPCLIVHGPITLRNLTFRHWEAGIEVAADGTLVLENCQFEDIQGAGVRVLAGGRVVIRECTFTRCGSRPDGTGAALLFAAGAEGIVKNCTIADNYGAGVQGKSQRVLLADSNVVRNNPNRRP